MSQQNLKLIVGISVFALAIFVSLKQWTGQLTGPSLDRHEAVERVIPLDLRASDRVESGHELSMDKYDRYAAKMRRRVPEGFTIIVEKPFVVIGDQTPAQVDRWATKTIRWCVKQVKELYFAKDPNHIVEIWLFKDKQSYESNVVELFGSKPTTPFGFYSPTDHAIVMNISTGGGTLVHEIVHPFVEANFAECPAWFNEGLASLYEQSSERSGRIVGLTNWRLRGLQLAIKDGFLPDFEKLMSTTDREFYDGEATNYGQARYLCYWLQEQGLLRSFYHEFARDVEKDSTGISTLKRILKAKNLEGFQKRWEDYVLELRFPE